MQEGSSASSLYRHIGMIAVLSWATCFLADAGNGVAGWVLMGMGWLAPLLGVKAVMSSGNPIFFLGCFAWYGNIPFMLCIRKLSRGLRPQYRTASIALGLALTSLAPIPFVSQDDMRANVPAQYFHGPAEWLWLISFAVVWVAALYARRSNGNAKHDN